MIDFSTGAAFDAIGAPWRIAGRTPGAMIREVSTDTRTVSRGDLFLAIRGPRFDASSFVEEAAERGAAGVVMEDREDHRERLAALHARHGVAVAVVPDAVLALGALATAVRAALPAQVLAITGSCGKTSTKRVAGTLLSASRRTVASPASFNNEIGVPHTVFLAADDTDVLIAEVGTNGPGEIAALAAVARPDVAIITNVGPSHLERLGSVRGVALEKRALFAALDPANPRARAIANLDDPLTPTLLEALAPGIPVVTFSRAGDERATYRATSVVVTGAGTRFDLHGPAAALGSPTLRGVRIPLLGGHAVANVLGALCAVDALGADVRAAVQALATLQDAPHRLQPCSAGGVHVIDDSYNANPMSMGAALDLLASIDARRVFVAGAMGELGEGSAQMHRELGAAAAAAGLDRLVLVATEATRADMEEMRAGARALGAGRLVLVDSPESAVEDLMVNTRAGDAVLVKASRAQRLERVVDGLVAALSASEAKPSARAPEVHA